jgi:hypothetical protein
MDYDDPELKLGQRIQLSALGRSRCPRIKVQTGVIVGEPLGRGVRVILDGSKTPITLHKSYVECLEQKFPAGGERLW